MMTNELRKKIDNMTVSERESFIEGFEVNRDYGEKITEEDYTIYKELTADRDNWQIENEEMFWDILGKGTVDTKEEAECFMQNSDFYDDDPSPQVPVKSVGDSRIRPISLIDLADILNSEGFIELDYNKFVAEVYSTENNEKDDVVRETIYPQTIRYYGIDEDGDMKEMTQIETNIVKEIIKSVNRVKKKEFDKRLVRMDITDDKNQNFKLEQVSVRLQDETPLYSPEQITTPEDAVRILGRELLSKLDREQICIVNLDSALKPINFSVASAGALNRTLVEPREMLKASILSNAGSVIILHNHPSGNLKPSKEDYTETERIIKSFGLIGINVLDHIIIGGNNLNDYYSMKMDNTKLFDDVVPLTGKLKFSDISEELLREIKVFLVAEDMSYWVNNTYITTSLTNEEAELILSYMDVKGYNLGVDDTGELVKIDDTLEQPTATKTNLDEIIYEVCGDNFDKIIETKDLRECTVEISEINRLQEELIKLKKDKEILDHLYQKTNLGKSEPKCGKIINSADKRKEMKL